MKDFVTNPSINQKFHLVRHVKPISFLHHFRSIVSGALLCISFTNAADVTWDITPGTVGVGNGSLTGGSGAWNTSTGNWTTDGGVNNRAWVNANNDTAIFGGTVGTGTVTLGTGITVGKLIFNTQNYSITGGILTVGTAGSITANANASIRSVLAGSAITKAGAGTLTLFGNNSYTGTMTVSAGTLSIGDGITNGTLSSSYRINSPGALRVRYNTNGVPAAWTGTIWNNFTGTGTLALATGKSSDGWGDAALTSNFTGTLQIQSGRVGTSAVTGGGFGGAKAIRVFAGGQLMDWRGSAITQNLTIAGTGYGEGGLECAIRMGENATPTILSGLVSLSGNVTIGARGTGILTNVISGAAGSTLTVGTPYSNGTVVIAADNTYVGPTMIAAGTLQVGGGGATGTLGASTVVNNGRLVFYRTGTLNVAQSIMGSGAISQEGSGTVTLAGANSYLGATTINAGTLTLGRSGALPSGSAVTIGDATLNAGNYTNSAGTLGITLGGSTPARIVFGSGGRLAFSDSSALLWPDFLQLVGNFVSGVSLRVGTTSSGLTDSQLQRIVAPGFSGFALNAQGYVTATAYTAPNFDSWQMANNTSQSFSGDLDGDGVTNGIEYFLHGTGDSSGADVFASVISSVGNPSVTWTKASTYPGTYGTDFVVQTSSTSASGPWTSQTAGSNLVLNGNSVKYIFPAGAQTYVRLVVNETVQEASLAIDTSNAIPLRSHRYRQDMFAVSLLGSAIKPSNGDPVYEIFFDTGSTQTCRATVSLTGPT
jgi:autotransporter-associated beta strand protein